MAGTKSKKSQKFVWELLAPRVNYLIGVFTSLEDAYDTACRLAEPNDSLEATKECMPLHYYDDRDRKGKEFYLIWDESVIDGYKDPPLLRITKLKLGKIYKDYDPRNETEEEEEDS